MHTDIASGDWIDRFLPTVARPYARLMRLDRPIGTWLLLLPCWWGAALAGGASVSLFLLFALGALVMRGAGCAINDLWDRELDKKVERTRGRPLASGALDMERALALTVILFVIGLFVLLQLNRATVLLCLASLPLVFFYPLAKRVMGAPQFILGLTFNWGALAGWTAARGTLEAPALALYAAGVFWTLAYDTIYAYQDRADDALAGVKSLALRLGDRGRLWIAGFFDASLWLLALAGWLAGKGWPFYVGLVLAMGHALWQIWGWDMNDPPGSLARFKSNRDFGLIVLLGLLLS